MIQTLFWNLDDIATIMALPNPSPVDEIEADFDTIEIFDDDKQLLSIILDIEADMNLNT